MLAAGPPAHEYITASSVSVMHSKFKRMQSSISNWFNGLQVMVNKEVPTVEGLLASATLSDNTVLSELLNAEAGLDVNRPDLINRGYAA
jgi:hypothetical protein